MSAADLAAGETRTPARALELLWADSICIHVCAPVAR